MMFVGLVDGFNLPVTIKAVNGTGNSSTAGCDGDLRKNSPSQLASKNGDKVIAGRSACDVFNTDEYCLLQRHLWKPCSHMFVFKRFKHF